MCKLRLVHLHKRLYCLKGKLKFATYQVSTTRDQWLRYTVLSPHQSTECVICRGVHNQVLHGQEICCRGSNVLS